MSTESSGEECLEDESYPRRIERRAESVSPAPAAAKSFTALSRNGVTFATMVRLGGSGRVTAAGGEGRGQRFVEKDLLKVARVVRSTPGSFNVRSALAAARSTCSSLASLPFDATGATPVSPRPTTPALVVSSTESIKSARTFIFAASIGEESQPSCVSAATPPALPTASDMVEGRTKRDIREITPVGDARYPLERYWRTYADTWIYGVFPKSRSWKG